ncbi:unnamed protein product [Helicobacter felis ATCC 49179]|uniref:Uncharacterized protein n=1 Tax=Helicobacter felis (strain ATCC 49179 / CCUG 28539 / NCTC 12436 / CS1) TaxID=936155 RepID=E7ACZ7_HELFC|nr:unnamed protein product [Helicobacter felis ATCC 49179]
MLTEQVETNFKPKQTQVVEPIKSELTTFYDKHLTHSIKPLVLTHPFQ